MSSAQPPPWHAAHDAAVNAGEEMYRDPATGYRVFTRLGLLRRARCCGSGCRHCPFDRQGGLTPQPTWKRHAIGFHEAVDVLSWSGGKDSFLALLALRDEGLRPTVLLTTHDADSGMIAHQDLHIDTIAEQAEALSVDLLSVPLHPTVPYEEAVLFGLEMVSARHRVERLVFGDLHLEEIRGWREQTFGPWLDAHRSVLHFPLWHASTDELMVRLDASGARVSLSAVPGGHGEVGQPFDAAFVQSLPEGVDPFGENGEFHTVVRP